MARAYKQAIICAAARVTYNEEHANLAITKIIYSKQQLYSLGPKYRLRSAIYHRLKEECPLKNRRKRGGLSLKRSSKCFIINNVIGRKVNSPSRCSRNGRRLNNLAPVNRCSVEPSSSGRPFNFCLLNVRWVKNKTLQIKDFAVYKQVDFLAITETWIKPDDSSEFFIRDICRKGYNFLHSPRSSGSGGGLAVLHKSNFKVEYEKNNFHFKSFEHMELLLLSSSPSTRFIIVYRPPPSTTNHLTLSLFFEEFASFLEYLVPSTGQIFVCGDFNLHVDDPSDYAALRFLDLLRCFDL